MSGQLYRKVMQGKKTTYQPVIPGEDRLDEAMTEKEIISAVANLAVLAINGYRQMLPPKSYVETRVSRVQESVLLMFKGTGVEIDDAIVQHVTSVWDKTMLSLSGGSSCGQ